MEKIINEIENKNYNINNISLLNIVHYKLNNEIIDIEQLEKIKDLIDYSIENIKEEQK